jgi:hypothetical protein
MGVRLAAASNHLYENHKLGYDQICAGKIDTSFCFLANAATDLTGTSLASLPLFTPN